MLQSNTELTQRRGKYSCRRSKLIGWIVHQIVLAAFLFSNSTVFAQGNANHALNDIFRPEVIADNTFAVREHAFSLPEDERFAFLADWVLPSSTHSGLRVHGVFQQTGMTRNVEGRGKPQTLVSPLFDLVDLAEQLGRIDDIQDRIEYFHPASEYQRRAKAAFNAILQFHAADAGAADASIRELLTLLETSDPVDVNAMWPETLAAYYGVHQFPQSKAVQELIDFLYSRRSQERKPANSDFWHTQIRSLYARSHAFRRHGYDQTFDATLDSADWIPMARMTDRSRGLVRAEDRWVKNDDDEMRLITGHDNDFLVYRLPLRGNFEVHADIAAKGSTQFLLGGRLTGPVDKVRLLAGTFRAGKPFREIDPPFVSNVGWDRLRAVFRHDQQTGSRTAKVALNGRVIEQYALSEHHSPWIGIRGWWPSHAAIRDVRITGNPEIPNSVLMSDVDNSGDWVGYHEGSSWNFVTADEGAAQIVGPKRVSDQGILRESLLCYQRPLLDGDSVEYEFYYVPGDQNAHPAIDRIAFLLRPDGVIKHWVTDGRYDATTVHPDNHLPVGGDSAKLHLQPEAWNRAKVALRNDTVVLAVNGRQVCSAKLESGNRRTFGLFHFADQETVRVRNVVLKGQWPDALPPPSTQELADPTIAVLDERLPALEAVFENNFAAEGLSDLLKPYASGGGRFTPRPDGVFVELPPVGNYRTQRLDLPFAIQGDFDLVASFEQLKLRSDVYSAVLLEAQLDDDKQHRCRVVRISSDDGQQSIKATLPKTNPDGSKSYEILKQANCDSTSGTFRLARRGAKVYYLFAEENSNVFRLLSTAEVTDQVTIPGGIQLVAICSGNGECQVLWKNVIVRAEKMMYMPQRPERLAYVMNIDGTNRRLFTKPTDGFFHVGSPEWSADGKSIVCDLSRGTPSTARVHLFDRDGTNPRDLGAGGMPSLSPDGKHIAFNWPGIMLMKSDGSERTQLTRNGLGVHWSPKGEMIAWSTGRNITLYDVDTKVTRELLTPEQMRLVGRVFWNPGWSNDGRRIAFHGLVRGEHLVAVADPDDPDEFKIVHQGTATIYSDFTWFPDNRTVAFSMHYAPTETSQMVSVDTEAPGPTQRLPGQPDDWNVYDLDLSHDGKTVIFSAERPGQMIEWTSDRAAE